MAAEVTPRFKDAPKRTKRGLDLESDAPLSRAEAEQLTEKIAEAVTDVHALILRALSGRADKALRYPSWRDYVEAEFPVSVRKVAREARPEHVAKLRAEGQSLRAIASVLGVHPSTVADDLAGVGNPTPENVTGIDGKTYPASIEDDERDAIEDTLYDALGDEVTDEDRERAVEENLESKRVPAITKPDLGDGVSHPARFSKALLPVFAELLLPGSEVLDPFAGVGGIHDLRDLMDVQTVGIELEPEWANKHPDTLTGSAFDVPFPDASFDAIVTSPTYGNRLADHHNASDPDERRSYTHDLGRTLGEDNTGDLHWGHEYREMHEFAWVEAVRVLRPGGLFVLNIKDHVRAGELQLVSMWHTATLVSLGLFYDPDESRAVGTPSLRQGENASARVPWEYVLVFHKDEYVRVFRECTS